jgi:hypothetical protein
MQPTCLVHSRNQQGKNTTSDELIEGRIREFNFDFFKKIIPNSLAPNPQDIATKTMGSYTISDI